MPTYLKMILTSNKVYRIIGILVLLASLHTLHSWIQMEKINDAYTEEQQIPPHSLPRAVRFVLVVGLQGTGHEVLDDIGIETPLQNFLTMPSSTPIRGGVSAMNSALQTMFSITSSKTTNPILKENGLDYESTHRILREQYEQAKETLIDRMTAVHTEYKYNTRTIGTTWGGGDSHPLPFLDIPLNIFSPLDNNGTGSFQTDDSFSHLTYPFSTWADQWMEHPSLDIFYKACEEAKVECGHLYLHRSLSEMPFKNVLSRNFETNTNIETIDASVNDTFYNLQFYNGYYQMLESQMAKHFSKTIDCIDVFALAEKGASRKDDDNEASVPNNPKDSLETLRDLFGFGTTDLFSNHLATKRARWNASVTTAASTSGNNNNNNNNNNLYWDIIKEQHMRTLRSCQSGIQNRDVSGFENGNIPSTATAAAAAAEEEEEDKVDDDASARRPLKFNSTLKYLFVIGIEGTGHHLLSVLLEDSPFSKANPAADNPHKHFTREQRLFSNNLMAVDSAVTPEEYQQTLDWFVRKFRTENEIVRKEISDSKSVSNTSRPVKKFKYMMKPLNCYKGLENSYPQYNRNFVHNPDFSTVSAAKVPEVRSMVYPSLELVYNACEVAEIDCGHAYLHRPPINVLTSTIVKRKYHRTVIEAIGLYTGFMQRIESDLKRHKDRTWGCIGLYDKDTLDSLEALAKNDGTDELDLSSTSSSMNNTDIRFPSWFDTMPALMGFQSSKDFAKHMQSKLSAYAKESKNKGPTKFEKKPVKRSDFIRMVEDSMGMELFELFREQHLRTIEECEKNIVAIEN